MAICETKLNMFHLPSESTGKSQEVMLNKVTDDLVMNAGKPDGQTEDVCSVLIAPYENPACHECLFLHRLNYCTTSS